MRDELDESQKDERNGAKGRFMFNIADGGFTGEFKVYANSILRIN